MKASTHSVKSEEFGGKASYTFITGDSECVVHNASGEADARKKLKETLQHAEFSKKQARRWAMEARLKAVTYV